MELNSLKEADPFFREYTSQEAILKYTTATAGFGISYLLDHDYKTVYLEAIKRLPQQVGQDGIRMLEFGCGGGMNLLHLVSVLSHDGFNVASAIGTDFSPVLIQAANKEAQGYLTQWELSRVQFCVAKNETLIEDMSARLGQELSKLENSFHFIIGVNTIRYCHRAGKQFDCARDIFRLLAPGGVCVVIDMNDRFPAFRSALKNKLRGQKKQEEECYLPSLKEYTAPFHQVGFEVLRSEHFCWIPHSAGQFLTGLLRSLSPVLNMVARSRAMRSLVVAEKPLQS
ncbi:MAG TPA: class I SAM-dependent methyltransferase [Methylomirabilota bacterium]|nr:class I SAM-dependent methyltransferase [Methylomirabilota bacterium]